MSRRTLMHGQFFVLSQRHKYTVDNTIARVGNPLAAILPREEINSLQVRLLTPRRPLRTALGGARTAREIEAQEELPKTISDGTHTGYCEPENYVALARRSRRRTVAAKEEIAPLFLPHAEHHSAPVTTPFSAPVTAPAPGAHNHPTLKPHEQHKHPYKVRQLRPAQTCNYPCLMMLSQGCFWLGYTDDDAPV